MNRKTPAMEKDAEEPEADGRAVSLYQRIIGDVRDRILSGEWQPGHRIPFEHELSAEYDCSRMTVNKAMSELAKAGLIERRRRSGSFVSRPRSQAAILEIHDIRAEVLALGLPYRYELVSRRIGEAEDDDDVGFPDTQLLMLSCRHFAGDQPFCLESRAINLETVPEAAAETFEEIAPGPWLLSRVPWSAAEHTISAIEADEAVAESLLVPRGSACLVVQRRTWTDDQPVTHVRLTYAGRSHSLVARFTPRNG